MNATKRVIYIISGSVFLILGAIGIFIPLLPTTPFWLLTCWFYLRSSDSLYNRAMRNRYFGACVKGFMIEKAISLHSKILIITVMWFSALLTSAFFIKYVWICILLLIISIGVTWHILSFPTKKD